MTVRNIALSSYALVCVASLGVLAFSSYTSQYVHIYCETICVAALGACAVNQRVQSLFDSVRSAVFNKATHVNRA